MATRSTIAMKVKKEDIGKTFHFDENKLPGLLNCENDCIDKVGDVTIEKPYLVIYHHWDGYPEGVGETLVKKFNNYDTILNLLCGGDASSINGDTIVQYCAWRGEEWDGVKPKQSDTEPTVTEEYVYLFDDGVWYFKGYDDDEWVNLKEYLEKNTDEDIEEDDEEKWYCSSYNALDVDMEVYPDCDYFKADNDKAAVEYAKQLASEGTDYSDIGHVELELISVCRVDPNREWEEIETVWF